MKYIIESDIFNYLITLIQYFISISISSFLCFLYAFANNCTLFEIYDNIFYASYFSFFFMIVGIFTLSKSYRSYITNFKHPDFIKISKGESFRFKYIFILGIFLILGSIFSVIIHIRKIHNANYIIKIPLFCVIGIGVLFALIVFTIDCVNILHSLIFYGQNKPPLFNYQQQIFYIIILGCIMGATFSFVFAVLDTENVKLINLETILKKEQYYLLPISIIFGSIMGICTIYYDKDEDEGINFININTNNNMDNEVFKPAPIKVEEV